MNIMIIGANGLLGRYLVDILKGSTDLFAVVRDKNKIKFKDNKVNVVEVDLTNFNVDTLPKSIDIIFYLAQSNRFREFPDGVNDMLNVNVCAPIQIVQWALKNGVKKFIYASSGGVYLNQPCPAKEFFQIDANNKLGFYLNSKMAAEMLLKNFASFFETFIILRPFFMYGAGQSSAMLIPRLINNVIDGNDIILNGIDGIRINPICILDAARIVAKTIDLKGEYIFNIAGAEIVSIRQLAEIVGELVGKRPIFSQNNINSNDLIGDISNMIEKLDRPIINIFNGIEKMVKAL
ncbi:NAD-dependent epimerase/dehydratase family protein [Campylobacter concisus]|uniref:NAD-dependent epimerase/dehydratase family protein n=1 Tax=Campylobacter concisus TaxID=199 RepID=UPI000CD7E8A3|nr:NAD(P)-dependent oxidoreductase [Campylobacter concisus]